VSGAGGWKAGKEAKAKFKNPRFSKDNTGSVPRNSYYK
jgi:hypothetical protein